MRTGRALAAPTGESPVAAWAAEAAWAAAARGVGVKEVAATAGAVRW